MSEPVNDAICPFCLELNQCQAHETGDCWCDQVVIPGQLLDLVPEQLKRRVCICRRCLQAYTDDPPGFVARLAERDSAEAGLRLF